MTEKPLSPNEFEALAKNAGLSIAEVCRRAKVAPSIFHRWKGGADLTIGSYIKLLDAVEGRVTESEPSA